MRIIEQPEPARMTSEWARRYLERLDQPLDPWETDFFRSGCNFLARDSATGAISCWKSMNLPIARRRETYTGPMGMTPLTRHEIDRLYGLLEKLAEGEDASDQVAALRRYR